MRNKAMNRHLTDSHSDSKSNEKARQMPVELMQSLDSFFESCSQQQNNPDYFSIPYDSEWPSPCYQQTAGEGQLVVWQPVRQQEGNSFSGVESALEMRLHEDFCAYFTRYYSFHLPATASQGHCELLQVSSQDDFKRLQENLIGHILMKQRLKQKITLFFALTDDDDYLLSLDNASGEVLLERVGRKPQEILAPSLAAFIDQLSPRRD